MNNIIIPYPNKKIYNFYDKTSIDGFIIGIKGFSENFNYYVDVSKVKEVVDLLKKDNKKVYIMLNMVYMNNKVNSLIKLLKKIDTLDVCAVIFSDISVFNIVKENKLKINLIWNSKMTTNSKTINFFEKRGLYGYMPTSEITISEIKNIMKNTSSKPMIKLFGYTNMATSSRSLLTNYLTYIKNKEKNNKYYMYEKITNEYYPVVEEENTNFFSSHALNGILEYKDLINKNYDFDVFLDDYLIDRTPFYNIIEAFIALRNNPNDIKFAKKLKAVIDSNMSGNTDNGFLNKKTIFKVK